MSLVKKSLCCSLQHPRQGSWAVDISTDSGCSWTMDPDIVLVSSLDQDVTMAPVCSAGPSNQNRPNGCIALKYQYGLRMCSSWNNMACRFPKLVSFTYARNVIVYENRNGICTSEMAQFAMLPSMWSILEKVPCGVEKKSFSGTFTLLFENGAVDLNDSLSHLTWNYHKLKE
ncbi:reticulocalbin-1-like protein [Cricetulus griseus]|uniref:Reticulocalbin-1-like protein n=1 Tax=Cricetulus griseus TaxID=10029 RepID=A0A061IPX0_CRIGR|nr:reticulocalbin-1-like protein [Cricetulus griseus]